MTVKTLKAQVPDEFVETAGGEEAARQGLTTLAVVELVRKHVISAGRGAELLAMNRWDFEDLLAEHHVPNLELTPDEVHEQAQPL